MLFHTPEFLFLLLMLFPIYWLIPSLRLLVLGIGNAIFYGWAGIGYLILFLSMSIFTYAISLVLERYKKKSILFFGIIINVLNLMFFKYSVFLLENIEYLFGFNLIAPESIWTKIILPIGISFYTFQLIAYIVDVYKDQIKPTKSFLQFWVFISFFGQLVAGPIMRGNEFFPQIQQIKEVKLTVSYIKYGVFFIIIGLLKKVAIADLVSPMVEGYFTSDDLTTVEAWIGAYLFGFQIYADFSAYSDIALGLGYLFGFSLAINFKTPYLSASPTEFWRRWHITLSNWIRDYIYIPLGGSRKGRIRTDVNLLAAMLISGLWHGAMWTFVIWGGIHGLMLIVHKLYRKGREKVLPNAKERKGLISFLYHWLAVFVTFQMVTVAWVFFRAESLNQAISYTQIMFTSFSLMDWTSHIDVLWIIFVLYIAHIVEHWLRTRGNELSVVWHRIPSIVRGLAYTAIIVIVFILLKTDKIEFIYFQF